MTESEAWAAVAKAWEDAIKMSDGTYAAKMPWKAQGVVKGEPVSVGCRRSSVTLVPDHLWRQMNTRRDEYAPEMSRECWPTDAKGAAWRCVFSRLMAEICSPDQTLEGK